jgi:CBS domain-containing protein
MPTVRELMQTELITIPPNAPLSDLVELLDRSGITGVPVVDEQETLVGIVTVRDVLRLAREMENVPEAMRWGLGLPGTIQETAFLDLPAEGEFFAYYVTPTGGFVDVRSRIRELPGKVFEGFRVEDIMTPAPVTIDPDASLAELARLLHDRKIHRALVVGNGQLVGIVTTSDVLGHLADE